MPSTLGFVILSHTATPLLARLLARLSYLYGDPPIVIHHDFSQAPLPLDEHGLGKNITIIRPHYRTRWAHISLVDATLTSLDALYQRHAPDWVSLLSTSCYPSTPPATVIDELTATPYDAFMGNVCLPLDPKTSIASPIRTRGERVFDPTLPHARTNLPGWLGSAYRRYSTGDGFFHEGYRCFVGDWWFTANAKCTAQLIASRREHSDLFYRYANVFCPEESYFQTVLCNSADLKICGDNRRYADWSRQEPHPRELALSDLPDILASGCHFARKVSVETSAALLDELDRITTPSFSQASSKRVPNT